MDCNATEGTSCKTSYDLWTYICSMHAPLSLQQSKAVCLEAMSGHFVNMNQHMAQKDEDWRYIQPMSFLLRDA